MVVQYSDHCDRQIAEKYFIYRENCRKILYLNRENCRKVLYCRKVLCLYREKYFVSYDGLQPVPQIAELEGLLGKTENLSEKASASPILLPIP